MNAKEEINAAVEGAGDDAPMPTLGQRVMAEVRFFAGLAVVMLAFLTLIWGHYKIRCPG